MSRDEHEPSKRLKTIFEVDEFTFTHRFGQIASDTFPLEKIADSRSALYRQLKGMWMGGAAQYPELRYQWSGWKIFGWSTANWTDQELEAELQDFKAWLVALQPAFQEVTRVFHSAKFLTPDDRKKHWVGGKLSDAKVVERSRKGQSYFFPRITPKVIESVVPKVMGRRFEEIFERRHKYFYMRYGQDVGGCRQKPTSLICFDLDYDTPVIHAYPVDLTDVDDPNRIDGVDELV